MVYDCKVLERLTMLFENVEIGSYVYLYGVKLLVESKFSGCGKCYFFENDISKCKDVSCLSTERNDSRSIMFMYK